MAAFPSTLANSAKVRKYDHCVFILVTPSFNALRLEDLRRAVSSIFGVRRGK